MAHKYNIGIIFDCDGTLVDSIQGWRGLEHELARLAGESLSESDIELLCTFTIAETANFYHTKFGIGKSDKDVIKLMDDFLLNFYSTKVELRPGAKDFVQCVVDAGIPCAVASSSPQRYLKACFEHVGLQDTFDVVLSTDDLQTSKREPKLYDYAANVLGTTRSNTWGFEDSIYAVHTLKNAGFYCVGVYDRDDSGTYDDLSKNADIAIKGFDEISPDVLLGKLINI